MSRSVDFELPDTKALTASSGRSRRGLRASDWDVNNIVVPVSIASPRALQIVKPREIVTPGWKSSKEKEQREGQGEVRLIDEDAPAPKRADGAASSSSENTADELYATRHTPHEKAERARWEPLALQKKRLQQEAANQQPNDFIVTGEFDQMQSGGKGGKGAPRRLDFGSAPAPRSHKKGGSSHAHSSGGGGGGSHASAGGSGANSRRMRPSRAGLYWMRSRFYADLKWELVRREGQADTVFVFRHVNGPIPHPPDRSAGGLKRNSVSDIVMEEDDEVEVTIRHRNPVPLSQATVAPVAHVAPPPTEPDPELAEAPYSPSRVGGDGLQMSANLSLSLASSVGDATMAEAEELEMHDAQLERSGDVDVDGEGEGEGDIRPEESRTFEEEEEEEEEEGAAHGKRGDGEGEEEGASPRQRAWAVRSMLNGVSEDSDVAIKVRSGASAAAKDSAASVSATATPAAAKTPAAAEQHAATHTTD